MLPGAVRLFPWSRWLPALVPLLGLLGCSASSAPKTPVAAAKPLFTPPAQLAPAPSAPTSGKPKVQLGIDVLGADGFAAVKGKRLGLLTHPAGVNRLGVSTIEVLRKAPGVRLVALYAAEHGLYGDLPAEAKIANSVDPRSGLPVISLYPPKRPTKAMLAGIDALVIDLQDIGTRSYTFAAAMRWAMEASFQNGVEVIVLDRPNPLGGEIAEGPLLDLRQRSFVGLECVPVRHGLTLGEVVAWRAEVEGLHGVRVLDMQGWRRAMRFEDTGLPWVLPSPNMPTPETAMVYPGQVLLEGTNLSEGRGTTRPFELFGAPWIQGREWTDALNALRLPGVVFREAWFTPSFSKHRGELCGGSQIHVTDPSRFRPVVTTLRILETARRLYPGRLTFQGPTFDRLLGTASVRPLLESGGDLAPVLARIESDLKAFETLRQPHLLYH